MSLKIYTVGHKKFSVPYDKAYQPIIGGMENRDDKSQLDGFLGDNTGDNISSLNNIFCELTAQYWIWKNDHTSEFVGLNHYRRFFVKKHFGTDLYYKYINDQKFIFEGDEIPSGKDFDFSNIDMVVPQKFHVSSAISQYAQNHVIEDVYLAGQQIKKIQPEYMDAYNFYFNNCNYFHHTNMMVAKREYFNEYSEWIFSLLLPLADKKFFVNYNSYQKRVLGFLAERLLSVWLLKNRERLSIEERPFVQIREL